jgi:protein-disulfide isomerase
MLLKYESNTIIHKLSIFVLAVLALGFQSGTGLINAEKEPGSSTHDLTSSDVRVEWSIRKILEIEPAPRDIEFSANGKWMFVLSRDGKIFVYSVEGELKDVIVVGSHVDDIKVDPLLEDTIVLTSEQDKIVQFLELAFIHDIDISNAPFKGRRDAPVVVVTYSDFLWPPCERLLPLLEQMLKIYPEKVKLVFKSYPHVNPKLSVKAAVAALAADRQGKFWEFHDLLYAHSRSMSEQKIDEIARTLGLNMQQFKKDVDDPRILDRIRSDVLEGANIGVEEAPAVFVNGRRLKNVTLQRLQEQIATQLAKIQ